MESNDRMHLYAFNISHPVCILRIYQGSTDDGIEDFKYE